MTSRSMLRRFKSGDPEAVKALYERFGKAVFVVANKALGDRWLAEEAVQLTFLRAWKAADRFDVTRDPAPWLYSIARRVAVDLYRRERRHRSADPSVEVEMVSLPPSMDDMWEAWQVRAALDELPDNEREIIRLTHFQGLTQQEAADRMGIPVGTVKSASFRAHRRLAGLLGHLREEATA